MLWEYNIHLSLFIMADFCEKDVSIMVCEADLHINAKKNNKNAFS